MQVVPLQPVASQAIELQLGGQDVTINVYQEAFGLFADVFLSGTAVVNGAVCENLNRIVRYAYLGFVGDLFFLDTQGTNDPGYTGLGPAGRFQLVYLETTDSALTAPL